MLLYPTQNVANSWKPLQRPMTQCGWNNFKFDQFEFKSNTWFSMIIFILNSKVPEDENKRERKDEKFEDQEEVDMNDETYGQNEPPEPEDLDMNADDEIGDGDNDNDENPDELPPEVFFLKK